MKCNNCDKPATVHLTQIINNKIIKVDLCEECAQAKGVTDPEGFSLADLLHKAQVNVHEEDTNLRCPDCGLTTADFRRTGRLGCSTCFSVFASVLRPVLEDMHVGISHVGKIPEVALSRQSTSAQLDKLEKALAQAISNEAYEEAAKFRDQIKSLKEDLAGVELSQS